MVTSRISYSMHYELAHPQDRVLAPLQELSRLRIDTREPNMPVLYVAMATWIPKCNMYHHNNSQPEASDNENPIQTLDDNPDTAAIKNSPKHDTIERNDNRSDRSVSETAECETSIEKQTASASDDKDASVNYDCKVVLFDIGESVQCDDNGDESILVESDDSEAKSPSKSTGRKRIDLEITPKKTSSPKQLQKKLESEKKRIERQKEKEEREAKRQKEKEERDMKKQKEKEEKLKQKQEKDEQRQKEKEMKEQKRREKEEKDEQKRKEREQEKLKRQQEIDERNREKQKIEEQKQKAAAVFVNFFVTKKTDAEEAKKKDLNTSMFMPFEVKSDMRLALTRRKVLSEKDKVYLTEALESQAGANYLDELKRGRSTLKMGKTWPLEDSNDDIVIVEENGLGETIVEQKPKLEKMKAKFLKFHENQRPPYFGTWRKHSKSVRPKNPLGLDKNVFNYELDSDDEWEEEGEGESLIGSDEDDKENDSDNEYEVDNDFFVPHGHLSDDEVDDEENAKLSPESHKTKLKLLKNEFDEEMKSKTEKIKPRVIGCIWYNKSGDNVEDVIDRYLQPLSVISNGRIHIAKRSSITSSAQKKAPRQLEKEHVPLFLKLIHGSIRKRKLLINEFLEYLSNNGIRVDVSKLALGRQFKELARWVKCPEQGAMYNKLCWYVSEDVRKEFNVDVSLPNKWEVLNKKDVLIE